MLDSVKTATSEIRRWDVAIAAALSILGLVLMVENVGGIEDVSPGGDVSGVSALAAPLFLAVTLPLAWRRAAPLGALAAAAAALLAHAGLFGELVRCGVAIPTTLLLLFAVAARLDLNRALVGLALGLGGGALIVATDPVFTGVGDAPFVLALMTIVWGIGRVVRSRSRLTADLETHTSELRTARDERAQLEVATDRTRLSGELDELLHRRLGELARLAGEGPRDGDTAATTATLVDIETESRRTLEEMRGLVGALREDSGGVATAPQPTLTHLEALLVRAKGTDAALSVEGNPRTLPAGVELSAYRVVEHLLAALDDSPDVDVHVRFADEALELSVCGQARRRAGAEMERARARVQLHHGTLETSMDGRRSQIVASLPVLAGA